MPDTTGIMGITSLSGSTDALSLLSNGATRANDRNGGRQLNANGQDFTTVIDATAMSIMAGAQLVPQAGTVTPPMVTETRSYNTVEITTRSTAARGNDYTQETGMARAQRTSGGDERLDTETAFDRGLDAALSDASAQMQEETAERLDVPEEQVSFAMQQTGLNPLDLLTEEGLTQLVTEVRGVDQTALLTDGTLYTDLQALIETADALKGEIAEDFGLTLEGMEEAIAMLTEEDVQPETVLPQTGQTAALPEEETTAHTFSFAEHAGDGEALVNNVSSQGRSGLREDVREAETDADFGQRVSEDKAQQQMPAAQATQEESGTGAQGQSGAGTQGGNAAAKTQTQETTSNANAAVTAAEGFLNTVNDALAQSQSVYGSGQPVPTQAQDVLRQIVEQMRAQVRPGVTELDMQLNPQSLGRVNVNLQSLDGGEVVARFTAQNETVREAIAAQMPQLLQRFEEQGIKVSEVQVAVAEHGFDDARDQNMRREEQRQEQAAGIERAGRMRRVQIDLANMSAEDIAQLGDDERVEAEMMAAQGNTVNYRA